MKTVFKKNGMYTIVIIPEDEIETGILKIIAKGNDAVILTTQNTFMLDQDIPIGSMLVKELSGLKGKVFPEINLKNPMDDAKIESEG